MLDHWAIPAPCPFLNRRHSGYLKEMYIKARDICESQKVHLVFLTVTSTTAMGSTQFLIQSPGVRQLECGSDHLFSLVPNHEYVVLSL
jgi:hypothetical protein